jgi:hypothetical protein
MPSSRAPIAIYVVNLALLATHQADAAYWREWEVFGIRGGAELFLVFTAAAVMALGYGLVLVASGHTRGIIAMWLCAATGVVTVVIHIVFLELDRTAFWTPASLVILGGIAVTSFAQLRVALANRS